MWYIDIGYKHERIGLVIKVIYYIILFLKLS